MFVFFVWPIRTGTKQHVATATMIIPLPYNTRIPYVQSQSEAKLIQRHRPRFHKSTNCDLP